ncbi:MULTISPECIES: Crp/Fnr family transcriptional regulator [unclassified Sinorhizobium]|uniref:Crp/Fnr family transcriptional regulator n=1 Tax=unclassified Sinorhizobium TaxID=2613772 RepID=UPI003525B4E3
MDIARQDMNNPEIPMVCRSCEGRQGGICGALSTAQLLELSRHSSQRTVATGCEIVGQGELVSSYCSVLKGVVKLSKVMSDGRQQIVGLQFAPDFVGRPYSSESAFSAEAAVETEVCIFPRKLIDRMVAETPELCQCLHNQALRELDEARDRMLTLGRKTAREKVASFLHLFAMHADPENQDCAIFDLPLSRAEIGDFLGLTIETVSRQMTRLRKEGIIRIESNRHIAVPDLDALNRASGND